MSLRAPLSRVVLACALAIALALPLAQRAPSEAASGRTYCARASDAAERRAAIVTGSGSTVLVIGDSWSAGWRLRRPADSWPVRLPGRVFVEGYPGSGFSARASSCGRVSYADRAGAALRRSTPDLVVLQGGLNDFDRSRAEITRGFGRAVAALASYDVVVVGPARAPSRARAAARVDRLLRRLSAAHGVPYVGTTDLRLPYLRDRLHLTQRGHRVYGDVVARRIAAATQPAAGTPGVGRYGSR